MLQSQKFATAARMHVLLRRKTGRVTDTEWLSQDAAYAREIIRFARASAAQDGHTELAEWADKLEAIVLGIQPPVSSSKATVAQAAATPDFADSVPPLPGVTGTALRYVRGIR